MWLHMPAFVTELSRYYSSAVSSCDEQIIEGTQRKCLLKLIHRTKVGFSVPLIIVYIRTLEVTPFVFRVAIFPNFRPCNHGVRCVCL